VKRQIVYLAVSIVAAAATLSTVGVAVPPNSTTNNTPDQRTSTESSRSAPYSSAALGKLQLLEATIASAGACNLSPTSLTNIISAFTASPLVSATGLTSTTAKTCANITAVANPNLTASALTSMWAWGNPVSVADDARGLGESALAPDTISAYAAAHNLANVRLSVPWASEQGAAITGWLSGSVADLHAQDETVSALGGDAAWIANPTLVTQWITAAHTAAPFDSVQLDIEPWTDENNWTENPVAIAAYVNLVRQAQLTAHSLGLKLGIDAPWWLSTTPYLSGSVLTAILPFVDTVSIVAFADHAGGNDGIIEQAWPAVIEANAALTPFTIGVQTSSDEVSGGAQYTFADRGSAVLETESNKVRAAYSTSLGYSGVTVEEYLSWLALRP
jgi:hypothetical protein